MIEPTVLFRADANVAMGTGHAMRCLALAQAWQDSGGRCVFAMTEQTPAITSRLWENKIEIESVRTTGGTADDAAQTATIAAQHGADWIVVDGYQFGSAYQAALKTAGLRVLLLDDNGQAASYTADVVLNQNLHAAGKIYAQRGPNTQLLLGPRYALLRREFRAWRNWRREHPARARKILITMGGSDPDNVTARVIDAVNSLADVEAVVLVGGSNPHLAAIEEKIGGGNSSVRLVVDAQNVGEWMAWADVAISGAGTTFWEMCFLGLPSVLLVLAENQEGVAATAQEMNIAWNLGWHSKIEASVLYGKIKELLDSVEIRKTQSDNGRKLVDGRGAERVSAFLSEIELRPTIEADCELFWEWANDADVRAASFRDKTISWKDHSRWFRDKMQDRNAIFYTATNRSSLQMGQVRYQIEDNRAVLSISLGVAFRGRGWGQKLLTLAVEKLWQESDVDFIDAFVKPANSASIKLFEHAGFLRLAPATIEGQEALHFVLERQAR